MKVKELYPYNPDYSTHPGETLAETMCELEISMSDLGFLMDCDSAVPRAIVDCKAPITREIAEKLESALNISADFWMAMQNNYDGIQKNYLTLTS